ncbi:MAG: hypothetical protein CMH48_10735 [Muricauda sp.]|nr:DUF1801 domain-containing protein [Allomuricauda sp.]MAU27071.1 hypothetical protein [Allomuricauda sp.]MBC31309.1 hypothetical protein [Allomuricauda sp.]|tara:strand:- start:2213 stop:2647 length:435 start_codon:yes stop_codon:yes gene_type:complete
MHVDTFKIVSSPEVKAMFAGYTDFVRPKMESLRKLIIEAAQETEGIAKLEETPKWGEPSYLTKNGSTIRIDWKPKKRNQYAIYFKCTSKLVPTFKKVYDQVFTFEGDRAIIFEMDNPLPKSELKRCIVAGLTYYKVKKMPLLVL